MYKKRIFFDGGSFVPPSRKVSRVVAEILKKENKLLFANAFSHHLEGRNTREYIKNCKKVIAAHLNISHEDFIFTSGATESNRIIVNKIIFQALKENPDKQYEIIMCPDEHISVSDILYNLPRQFKIIKVFPNEKGLITPEIIEKNLTKKTLFVSTAAIYPSTGIIQPVRKINNIIKKYAKDNNQIIFTHCDAAQLTQFLQINCESLKVDSISMDGCKIGAMLGVGLLFFKKSGFVPINPSITGTPKTALIAGYAKAMEEKEYGVKHLRMLQIELLNMLFNAQQVFLLYGLKKILKKIKPKDIDHIAPHILKLHFPEINGAYFATLLDREGFPVSVCAACMMDADVALKGDFIRVSLSYKHSKKDVIRLTNAMIKLLPKAKRE